MEKKVKSPYKIFFKSLLYNIKRYSVAIVIALIYFGLKFCSIELFPDILNLASVNPTSFFQLLISSTTSIFGILTAVILLAFQFVKNISFRRKEENILSKKIVINIVSVAICIVIFSLISYSSIPDFKKSNNLSIAYFLGFLFVSFIILIFPAIREILEFGNRLKKVKEEITNLRLDHFTEIHTLQDDKFISKNNNLVLIRIRQELLNTVRECDFEAYAGILEELNNKALQLIGKGESRDINQIVFRGTSFIWSASNFEALRVGNFQFYETVWECVEELYEYAAKEKIYLLHYQFLELFIGDFIKFLTRNKLGDALSTGVKVLSSSFKQNLKFNCPPQEEINILYHIYEPGKKEMPHNIESNLQWDHLRDIVRHMRNIQIASIQIADRELFDKSRFELENIVDEINWNYYPKLGIYQEAIIVGEIISYLTYNGFNANEERLFKESMWSFYIHPHFLSDLIKKEKFYVGRILQDISDFIIKSMRKDRLEGSVVLNDLGTLGRAISEFYLSNKLARQAMEYLLDTFDQLKSEIESSKLPDQADNYHEIKKQVQSIKDWFIYANKDKEIPFQKRIDLTLSQFKDVSGIKDYGIVRWKKDEKIN